MKSRIRDPEHMKQLIDFQGLGLDRGIHPTDIDGIIEYHDLRYIVFEIKSVRAQLPKGQRLALQRMVDDFARAGKRTVVVIAEHDTDPKDGPVIAADCNVRAVYFWNERRWRPPHQKVTLRELVDMFPDYSTDDPIVRATRRPMTMNEAHTLIDF